MWKYLATPMLALILCINHAVADDTTRETSLDHCAILTWPDGHQSRVNDFVEAPQFADACALKSGCKIDGHEFFSIDQLKNALSDATMKCLFPPASTLNKGECTEQQDSSVDNDELGIHVGAVIQKNPHSFLTGIEPSQCKCESIQAVLKAVNMGTHNNAL